MASDERSNLYFFLNKQFRIWSTSLRRITLWSGSHNRWARCGSGACHRPAREKAMRLLGPSFAVICAAYLNAMCGFAQGVDQHQAEEKLDPYNKHHDLHHGHQHTYPDRGAIFREVPRGAIPINYAGLSYRFHDGVWFEPRGPAFIVVAPPIGVVVPTLPAFASPVEKSGETYLYANDVYYRARPDLGGHQVAH